MDEKVVLVRARVLLMRASVDLMKARKSSLKSKNRSTLPIQRRLHCHTLVQMNFISRRWSTNHRIEVQPNVYLHLFHQRGPIPLRRQIVRAGQTSKCFFLAQEQVAIVPERRGVPLIVQDAGLEL